MSDEEHIAVDCTIEASVGEISLTVDGEREEWVERVFDEKLETLMNSAVSEMVGDSYHLEAGAGSLMAHGEAESPAEAYATWLDMWERMIDDVKELSEKEREQAGFSREL